MDVSKLKTNDWIVAGGTLLATIGMFLDWYKVTAFGMSASGESGWGQTWAVLGWLCLVAATGICLAKAFGVELPLPTPEGLTVLVLGGVAVLCVLIKFVDKPDVGGGSLFGSEISVGYAVGIFFTLIGAAGAAVGGFLKNKESV